MHGVQPTFHNTRRFCIFPMNFGMATLGLKEMGKFLWEDFCGTYQRLKIY